MSLDDKTVTLIIGALGVLIAFLTYRLAALSRKENQAKLDISWKIPIKIPVNYKDTGITDLYFFIEAIMTNKGGKTVSAVELVSDDTGFLEIMHLNYDQPIVTKPYTPMPVLYILAQPIQDFMGEETVFRVHKEQKQRILTNEIPLNVAIEAGKSERLSLCFYVEDYREPKEKGENHIFSVSACFNNGQSYSFNTSVGGSLSAVEKMEKV